MSSGIMKVHMSPASTGRLFQRARELKDKVERLQARVAELEVDVFKITDDEDDAMNQVFFLAQSIQESPECIGIVKRKAGVESISVNLRDYLEDLGVLPVSRDRLFLSCGAEKTGGSENAK